METLGTIGGPLGTCVGTVVCPTALSITSPRGPFLGGGGQEETDRQTDRQTDGQRREQLSGSR